jgi:hypothetical protein
MLDVTRFSRLIPSHDLVGHGSTVSRGHICRQRSTFAWYAAWLTSFAFGRTTIAKQVG